MFITGGSFMKNVKVKLTLLGLVVVVCLSMTPLAAVVTVVDSRTGILLAGLRARVPLPDAAATHDQVLRVAADVLSLLAAQLRIVSGKASIACYHAYHVISAGRISAFHLRHSVGSGSWDDIDHLVNACEAGDVIYNEVVVASVIAGQDAMYTTASKALVKSDIENAVFDDDALVRAYVGVKRAIGAINVIDNAIVSINNVIDRINLAIGVAKITVKYNNTRK